MERLTNKYNNLVKLHKALATSIERYKKALNSKDTDIETLEERRDSLIKRFELTYDLLWKYLPEYMIIVRGTPADARWKIFQQCFSLGITNESETEKLVDLIHDRNLTHIYDIDLANKIAFDIQKHHDVIASIISKVSLDTLLK